MVGEEHNLSLVLLIPDHNPAKNMRTMLLSLVTRKSNELVRQDVAVLRDISMFNHRIVGIVLQ